LSHKVTWQLVKLDAFTSHMPSYTHADAAFLRTSLMLLATRRLLTEQEG